ncbi:MAG TPA: hypothetical protein VGM08_01380, partial [Candidatus Saccharimonadales bacterium]
MLREIDSLLNKITMYKLMVYGLCLLLAIAAVLGFTGAVSISSGALLVSVGLLIISCYAANKAFSVLLHVPTNTESWLISALILACILPQADSASKAAYTVLAGLLAMASKFVIRYRGRHVLNPAALGAGVVSVTGLLAATWWIATPWMTPFTALLAFVVLRKQHRFQMFFCFAAAAVSMLVLTGTVLQGVDLALVLRTAVLSWPIIFFGSIMLTEPATLPPTRYYQLLLAVIVGLLFASQLHVIGLSTTPQAVLLVGNVLSALAIPARGYVLRLKGVRRLTPTTYEVSFNRPPGLRFRSGQYAELTMAHARADSRGNRRTFSIVSSPAEPEVRFAFKVSGRGSSFKKALVALKPDSPVRLSHIAGDFTLPQDTAKPLLFIAGGIGATPYHSMIGSLTSPRDIVLLYLVTDLQDVAYQADFDQAVQFGVRTEYVQGRLTHETLQRLVPDLDKRLVYISGPDGLVRSGKTMIG